MSLGIGGGQASPLATGSATVLVNRQMFAEALRFSYGSYAKRDGEDLNVSRKQARRHVSQARGPRINLGNTRQVGQISAWSLLMSADGLCT